MEMTKLGSAGPVVSRVGLGCMAFSGSSGPAEEPESIATIHAALDVGVNLHRDLTRARELRGLQGRVVRDGGWHFSSMGGVDRVCEKLAAFAHREYDTPAYADSERLTRRLERGADIYGRDVA
jgi:hypothetical protein